VLHVIVGTLTTVELSLSGIRLPFGLCVPIDTVWTIGTLLYFRYSVYVRYTVILYCRYADDCGEVTVWRSTAVWSLCTIGTVWTLGTLLYYCRYSVMH